MSKIQIKGNMVLVTVGYRHMLFPLEEGLAVFRAFERAVLVDNHYEDGKTVWRRNSEEAAITLQLFTEMQQAQLLMEGGES